jgi:hypothetical protein
MHQQFNIQQLYVLPTLYLCVLYLSQNKQRLVPLITTYCAVVMKSGNLNFLKPSGPLRACNGTALPNLGTLTSWNPLGHSRPVRGPLYIYIYSRFNCWETGGKFALKIVNMQAFCHGWCTLTSSSESKQKSRIWWANVQLVMDLEISCNVLTMPATYLYRTRRI